MAKRGERRPWQVRFEWSNGTTGVNTFTHLYQAARQRDEILERAYRRNVDVTVTITNRDTGLQVPMPPACQTESGCGRYASSDVMINHRMNLCDDHGPYGDESEGDVFLNYLPQFA